MICERCGTQSDNGARICPRCGAALRAYAGKGSVSDIRQGRSYEPPPVHSIDAGRGARYAQDAGRPELRRGVSVQEGAAEERRQRRHEEMPRSVKRRGVNRALLITVLLGILLVTAVVSFVLLLKLPQGHLLLLRYAAKDEKRQERFISMIGAEESAVALWIIGQEQIDQGYISRSIETFEKAYALNPEIDRLYERLLSLANAYEAADRQNDAEKLYEKLYTQVQENNPQAYRYAIDILIEQGRLFEATDLMQLAYEKTKELSFKSQREQLVPLSPTSTPDAGRYKLERTVSLASPQDYDVYYVLDDSESELPENGILYTEPIQLSEGSHEIRAVCVSSQLISDEVSLKYTIWYPTPSAPKSRLLTGEYDTRRRVYLYMEPEEITGADKGQIVTIYYTLDGTPPTIESPIYTDEGFVLPPGKVQVRAVAVNQYGKVSNEYVGDYKINMRFENYFRDENDQFKSFTLGKTTYSEFKNIYGPGQEATVGAGMDTATGEALRVTYGWGDAYFTQGGQVLYSVNTSFTSMAGPRNTRVGMKLSEITAAFRDMGQAPNANGDRSIYYNGDTGYGKYFKESDNTGRLEYVNWRAKNAATTLTYYIKDDIVTRIDMTLSNAALE